VEKEFNFYASTPIKNKLFLETSQSKNNFDLLGVNSFDGAKFSKLTLNQDPAIGIKDNFTRQLKSVVEGGELKLNIRSNTSYNLYTSLSTNSSFDLNLSEYQLQKSYYSKNLKNSIKGLDEINPNGLDSFWSLQQSNNVARVYPNLNKTLLAGNLLISSKESEGGFNTNLVSIKNPE